MSGPADPPPYEELVVAAMAATGSQNASQLATALGYTRRNEDKKVGNWVGGTNAPSYDGTMRMLAVAGWLNEAGEAHVRALAPQQQNVRQEELSGQVDELTKAVTAGFRKLDRRLKALEPPQANEAPRARSK